MPTIARAYIALAHAIEKHNPGYIDGYYGPDEWKDVTQRPLDELAVEASALARDVESLSESDRRDFLRVQVRAMETAIRLLQGEPIPYREEVERLYDVSPVRVPESQFDDAITALDELLPGSGDVATRELAFRQQFEVPAERLGPLTDLILSELRGRARLRFQLPEEESFEVRLVSNEPWGAYNWYLGGYRSRIDINTDLPLYLTTLPDLMAHEGYPGHHTEHAIKERQLLVEQERLEHSILLINAPECVTSEGIATRALRLMMDETEVQDWLLSDLRHVAGLPDADVAAMMAVGRAKREMRAVTGNAAFLLHEEGASEEEVIEYLQHYRLATPDEARKSVQFITHPNFRSYIFTYTLGGALLDQLFERGNMDHWFARLLREPVTPATIRGWIASSPAITAEKRGV